VLTVLAVLTVWHYRVQGTNSLYGAYRVY